MKFANYPPVASVCRMLRAHQCCLYKSSRAYGYYPNALRCTALSSIRFCVNLTFIEFCVEDQQEFEAMLSILKDCRFNNRVCMALYCTREAIVNNRSALLASVEHLRMIIDCCACDDFIRVNC